MPENPYEPEPDRYAEGTGVIVGSTYTAVVVKDNGGPELEVITLHDHIAGTGITQHVYRVDVARAEQ